MATEDVTPIQLVQLDVNEGHDSGRFEKCQYLNGSACKVFTYDDSMSTIVSEWDMACDLSWIPPLTASLQMAGLLIGNIICGHIADSIGRKIPLFISQVILIMAHLIGYFANGWVLFAVARILCGFGMGSFLTVHYSLLSESTLARMRPWVLGFPSWPLESCVFCLVAYLMHDWRTMHLMVALVTVPFLAAWWFIPDSFRWYLSHDRPADAKKVIQFIAKINSRENPDDVTNSMSSGVLRENVEGDHKKYTILDMFKTKRLIKITLLSILNWFSLGLVSYGISFGIQALSGNFYLNLFLFSVITLPLYFVAIWMCNRFGRRQSIVMCYSITAIGALVVGSIHYIEMEHRDSLISAFVMISSLGINSAWGPVSTVTMELYPTVIRNIAFGFLNVFARVGAMVAPQLAFVDTKVAGLMFFICSFMCAVCVIGTLALAETKGRHLNDRIEKKTCK